jgi:hypothetical protein
MSEANSKFEMACQQISAAASKARDLSRFANDFHAHGNLTLADVDLIGAERATEEALTNIRSILSERGIVGVAS